MHASCTITIFKNRFQKKKTKQKTIVIVKIKIIANILFWVIIGGLVTISFKTFSILVSIIFYWNNNNFDGWCFSWKLKIKPRI